MLKPLPFRLALLFLFLLLSSDGYRCHQLAAQQQQLDAVKTNSLIDSSALLLSLLLANNGSLVGGHSDSKFGPVEDPELDMTTVSIYLLPLDLFIARFIIGLNFYFACNEQQQPQLIAHRGYPVEVHQVTTCTGKKIEYILHG